MTTELITTVTELSNWTVAEQEEMIGNTADHHAAAAVFDTYHGTKSARTVAVHQSNLGVFA
jgi:hypothetical protein